MKKIVLLVVILMAVTTVGAQTTVCPKDTAQFMHECRQFDKFVTTTPFNKQVVDSLCVCQDTLIAHYRAVKPQLNDSQVEEYNRIKGRFTRRVIEYRGDKVGEGLQATGDSIAKAAGRVGKAVGGFFKGIFER